MGRARAVIAARTSIAKLLDAAVEAYGFVLSEDEQPEFEDFQDAVGYCRQHCEELGGDEGSEAWYIWQVGEWAVLGDLTTMLQRDEPALEALSTKVGTEVVVAAIDPYVEYACFGAYAEGRMKRRLALEEDGEYLAEGLPVAAERGRHLDDFDEEECERVWTSYKLPTFEHDPVDGPFRCAALKKS